MTGDPRFALDDGAGDGDDEEALWSDAWYTRLSAVKCV